MFLYLQFVLINNKTEVRISFSLDARITIGYSQYQLEEPLSKRR